MRYACALGLSLSGIVVAAASLPAQEFDVAKAAATLRDLDSRVILDADEAAAAREVVRRNLRAGLDEANRRSTEAWRAVKSQADWASFRDERLDRLRASLSQDPLPTEPRDVQVTKRIDGDGFTIENTIFTSRPGVWVTANLYRPNPPRAAMPAIVICHSHHAPKTQGELQDMGMTWARQGAIVLVMDQLGHGERRTHSFGVAGRYPRDYKPDRQDYAFRYNTAVQLSLVGESLIGWMVGDLMCGVGLVASQPGVDPKKIILLGAVAGGGDPAGVTAALDPRIAAVVPFNYGGYEPEDVFPLPDDADDTFDYAGSGSWESTRNLRLSARDGFLPWAVVASVAPRNLVYAHEFRWDEPRDPVWKRLQSLYTLYDARDHLSSANGRGTVKGRPPEASHCTNIGTIHRSQLYPLFEKWFGLKAPTEEYSQRLPSSELLCRADDTPFALHEVLQKLAAERLFLARMQRDEGLDKPKLREALRKELGPLLGTSEPSTLSMDDVAIETQRGRGMQMDIERICPSITGPLGPVPLPIMIVRRNDTVPKSPPPVVVCVAQGGKDALLKQRSELIAACLARGAVVVLPDLRSTGETVNPGDGRGRQSGATSRSSSAQMLGQTMLGLRVADLRGVVRYLRGRNDLKESKISLYGAGLVDANPESKPIAAPLDADDLPKSCEPGPALICLLAALWEDRIESVVAEGGLVDFYSMLASPYFYVPHDAVVPGLLAHADVADLFAAQDGVWVTESRDAVNRSLPSPDDGTTVVDFLLR